MKIWKKALCVGVLGIAISSVGGVVAPQGVNLISVVQAAEMAPTVDTWILSGSEGTQYYIKGGTLQIEPVTRAMREAGSYSFRAQIISVYPDGRHSTDYIRMSFKGTVTSSINGGPTWTDQPGSFLYNLYYTIVNRYVL